jgi:hypothetical protein
VKPSSRKVQKLKVRSSGLRAPAAGSAPSAARAVDSRCVRLFSFCCQSLLPWPFSHRGCTWTRISSAHMWVTWQHEMGCCATQTTLIDVVHGGTFTCALLTSLVPRPYAALDTRTMRPLLKPVPLKQRLPAAFTTCTSRRAVVPRTRAMEAARQLGSIGAAKPVGAL